MKPRKALSLIGLIILTLFNLIVLLFTKEDYLHLLPFWLNFGLFNVLILLIIVTSFLSNPNKMALDIRAPILFVTIVLDLLVTVALLFFITKVKVSVIIILHTFLYVAFIVTLILNSMHNATAKKGANIKRLETTFVKEALGAIKDSNQVELYQRRLDELFELASADDEREDVLHNVRLLSQAVENDDDRSFAVHYKNIKEKLENAQNN